MKRVNIIIVRLLIFFYLTSSYLSATHIHHEVLTKHSECKVCIIVKNLHGADIPYIYHICLNCVNYYKPIIFKQKSIYLIQLKGFHSNAPPYFS